MMIWSKVRLYLGFYGTVQPVGYQARNDPMSKSNPDCVRITLCNNGEKCHIKCYNDDTVHYSM